MTSRDKSLSIRYLPLPLTKFSLVQQINLNSSVLLTLVVIASGSQQTRESRVL